MATGPQLPTALPSAQEWKDLLEELLPPQGNWTEEEYLVLTDHRNRLVEFTDGFVVSKEKPERHLVGKRGDYADGHVPEFWIVNPLTETITVLRLRGDAYEEAGIYRRGESAASMLLPEISVDVGAVFDAD